MVRAIGDGEDERGRGTFAMLLGEEIMRGVRGGEEASLVGLAQGHPINGAGAKVRGGRDGKREVIGTSSAHR